MNAQDYPFAQELITDTQGHVLKVVINFQDYERIIEAVEDEGLHRAMMEIKDETPLSFEEALAELDKE
jgi:RelB Antitoxin alpha helical domain